MNLSPKDRDQILRYGVIGGALVVVFGYGYFQLHTPDAPAPVAPVTVAAPARSNTTATQTSSAQTLTSTGAVPKAPGGAATKVATTGSQYDPTLKMEAMLVTESLVYTGSGRNIFSASSTQALAAIPQPKAPVRPVGVVLPVYTPPPGPPPPPPIDLKFFGTATKADGSRQAFLLHGDDVFLASTGSIVQRRYKVGVISANTVEVEDLTNSNKQTLQLQRN